MLVAMHTGSNTGYAVASYERAFLEAGRRLTGDDSRIHFAYRDLDSGFPDTLPSGFKNVLALDVRDASRRTLRRLEEYVRDHEIPLVLAVDVNVLLPAYKVLRHSGVRAVISYWGAPMSSLNAGLKLLLKRLEVQLRRGSPDHYIFESEAMRQTAVNGRGIPVRDTSVIYLGVDTQRFCPPTKRGLTHSAFGISPERKIVVYSGHMEPRKGVDTIVRAAVELVVHRGRRDVHFLFLGNRDGQERRFSSLYLDSPAAEHITFGGYRDDVPVLFAGSDIGCIASTGWDSFTMSAVELASCGLPLVVSSLQGLRETVEEGVTGATFPPGDFMSLANQLSVLLDDAVLRSAMGSAARERVLKSFTVDRQVGELAQCIGEVWTACVGKSTR